VSLHSGEIDRAWAKLGMSIKENGDVQALFFHGGRLILRTRRSKGRGRIDGQVPYFIRQQMRLTDDQFRELIACPLRREEYIEILRDKGLL
jgi:hypothetical protein